MIDLNKKIILIALLTSINTISAQTSQDRGATDDSTRVGTHGNDLIANPLSDPNSAVIAPMYCPNQAVSWAVGANGCSGIANMATPEASRNVIATGTNTGSATFTCNSATNTFSGPIAGATCVVPIPPPPPVPPLPPAPAITTLFHTIKNQDSSDGDGVGSSAKTMFGFRNMSGATVVATGVQFCSSMTLPTTTPNQVARRSQFLVHNSVASQDIRYADSLNGGHTTYNTGATRTCGSWSSTFSFNVPNYAYFGIAEVASAGNATNLPNVTVRIRLSDGSVIQNMPGWPAPATCCNQQTNPRAIISIP